MLVPYNSKELAFATTKSNSAAASPFVVAIQISGIKILPGILNGCILLFVFSAASNSDLYVASRTLFGLACAGSAPSIFARTDKRGVPIYALGLSAAFQVFLYFTNVITIFGLLTWISILVTHIYFCRARKAQGLRDQDLPYVAPFGVWGDLRSTATFYVKNFVTGYIGIPLYIILIFGCKITHRGLRVQPEEADLFSGKDEIDKEEEAFLAAQAEKGSTADGNWFYRTFISWLF
ncbi:uncharacterized protein FOMMEDRAFT_134044 [Fomitiporia mediterranea MF3/22]|uniref:uncharacterized protein n=1 Tax=Fomitiporia mediterranea (strain MF3/22) TaxID=694068 RepID=UPI000440955A|nr:uncharacterized protein FOMMEDRAFT_134044 [Fomitiporia mediterranea MF3/22]EJD02847.1 hypothetical protein FOMMEDRAFT_134044 [Fomitiporia mediterranea MF3/22]